MRVGSSCGWVGGLAAVGWLLVCRANVARPDACWHATRLPIPGADVRFPVSVARSLCAASRFPAALDPALVSEQTRCSQVACLRRAGQLVSSNPTVPEAAPFVQQNLQAADFRGLSGW